MRLFELHRSKDITGFSGTGVVAEGVEFTDGSVSLRWLSATPTTALHPSIETVKLIHGHNGATKVVWID